jgi:hypothetical protein
MTNTIITVDDIVFGSDPARKLPTVDGYDWMGQIDYKFLAMRSAVRQFMDVVDHTFRSLPMVEGGVQSVPVLSAFDDRLESALADLPFGNVPFIPDFKQEVVEQLAKEIPCFQEAPTSDVAFLASVYGTLVRYFRPRAGKGIDALKDVNLIAELPKTSFEWTLSAMSVTAVNMAALAHVGALEMTEARKSAILSDMERTADDILASKQSRVEFVEAFRNSAVKTFREAPTVEIAASATPASLRM